MRKRNPVFCLVILSFFFALIAPYQVFGQEDDSPITYIVGGALSFLLSGQAGDFRENSIGYYSIKSEKDIVLEFSASDLVYSGPHQEQAALDDVCYWINNDPEVSFRPGKSLILGRKPGNYEFSIHGRVTIKNTEAQPAGEYKGTIYVTISPVK